jgi:alkylhydroperoxidase/carboxymuconolactone decarboxylase family protein YurZ
MKNIGQLHDYLRRLELPDDNRQIRLLSVFSAVIAVGNYEFTVETIKHLKSEGVERTAIYETILQCYLFLGFPRMIEAGLAFNQVFGDLADSNEIKSISVEESEKWFQNGSDLCRKVYGKNYDRLKKRFLSVSPEIFRWMVVEGYGKVLSRPGLTQIERELAEVTALIVDNRQRQLISHVIGSLNVGADFAIIRNVVEDIRPLIDGKRYRMARNVINSIEVKNEKDI